MINHTEIKAFDTLAENHQQKIGHVNTDVETGGFWIEFIGWESKRFPNVRKALRFIKNFNPENLQAAEIAFDEAQIAELEAAGIEVDLSPEDNGLGLERMSVQPEKPKKPLFGFSKPAQMYFGDFKDVRYSEMTKEDYEVRLQAQIRAVKSRFTELFEQGGNQLLESWTEADYRKLVGKAWSINGAMRNAEKAVNEIQTGSVV